MQKRDSEMERKVHEGKNETCGGGGEGGGRVGADMVIVLNSHRTLEGNAFVFRVLVSICATDQ